MIQKEGYVVVGVISVWNKNIFLNLILTIYEIYCVYIVYISSDTRGGVFYGGDDLVQTRRRPFTAS